MSLYPPPVGRNVRLRPIMPADIPALYDLVMEYETSYRWRFRGTIPPIDAFASTINDGVLQQSVAVSVTTGALCGHVLTYNSDLRSGHTFLASVVAGRDVGGGIGTEMSLLFVRDLLARWPLRKIYFEIPQFTYEAIQHLIDPVVGPYFTQEARYLEYSYFGGRHWDQLVFSAKRDDWLELASASLPSEEELALADPRTRLVINR